MDSIRLGAVIYSPNVTIIWGIIADFMKEKGCEIEPVFFKDYKMQVDALIAGDIDIAWNSPLAWLDSYQRSKVCYCIVYVEFTFKADILMKCP